MASASLCERVSMAPKKVSAVYPLLIQNVSTTAGMSCMVLGRRAFHTKRTMRSMRNGWERARISFMGAKLRIFFETAKSYLNEMAAYLDEIESYLVEIGVERVEGASQTSQTSFVFFLKRT